MLGVNEVSGIAPEDAIGDGVEVRKPEDEKGVSQIDTPGGEQSMTVINESGLYAALFAMQPEKARGVDDTYIEERMQKLRAFKRWITHKEKENTT